MGEVIRSSIVPRLRSSANTPMVSIGVRNRTSVESNPKKARITSMVTSIFGCMPISISCICICMACCITAARK